MTRQDVFIRIVAAALVTVADMEKVHGQHSQAVKAGQLVCEQLVNDVVPMCVQHGWNPQQVRQSILALFQSKTQPQLLLLN